ncbi:MAG: EAL domain-containing protein [Bacteroidota bacterium]
MDDQLQRAGKRGNGKAPVGDTTTGEQQWRALSDWQRVILESANHAIIATAIDGTILSFNAAAERLLGYAADEVIGRHTPALIHDADEIVARSASLSLELDETIAPGFEVFIAKARRGEPEEREWTYRHKDGSRVPVLLSISAMTDDHGNVVGFLGVAVDLTLRKELERSTATAQAHQFSAGIISVIAEGILCLSPEPPYRIRFANAYAARLLGISESALKDQPLDDALIIRTETIKDPNGLLQTLKPLDATAFEAEVSSPARADGFPATLTIARTAMDMDEMLVLTIQDISHRRQIEQTLRLSSKVFEVCSEAIMITDVTGRIINVNPAFCWLTGYRPDEVIGQNPRLLKSGIHDAAFYQTLWKAVLEDGQWSGEVWDKRKDGSIYPKWVTIDAVRENGAITHFVALAHDISLHKEQETRIRHLAEHDALTGLPNRRILTQRATQLIESQRQGEQQFAVVLIDLDRFKNINDTLGHLVGDQILVEVSRRLVQGIRATDTVVRLGGDEFVALLTDIDDPKTVSSIVSNIHRKLGEPIRLEGRALYAPPSIGIACYPGDGADIETLLRNADAAMYQTKAHGRNGWTFYTAEMNQKIAQRMALEEALREALDAESLQLHFQPLLQADTHDIVSWEALLRWQHPLLGDVSPERIIPVAEETGLIHQLGNWVIRTACRQVRQWESDGLGRFRVSVNVSPSQLENAGLVDVVIDAIKANAIAPDQLELEITESVLMSHSPVARQTLETLRDHGVILTLDDFGTGYSSLTYLKTLSVDRVKIDRSFITNILHDKSDASIVQAIVTLANNLSLGVVAEGVETEEQHAFLEESGCMELQGFLLGRPMPAEKIPLFMSLLATTRKTGSKHLHQEKATS